MVKPTRGGRRQNISAERKLHQIEEQYRDSGSEHGVVIDGKGNIILEFSGDEHNVVGDQKSLNAMKGNTATHNHPTNTTFSTTDISNGIARGELRELRATNPDGTTHVLNAKDAGIDQRRSFSAQYGNQRMKAERLYNERVRKGYPVNGTKDEYVDRHLRQWMKDNASNYGMTYEERKR